jgi:hypothetical protein
MPMKTEHTAAHGPAPHKIEVNLREISQLFNSMDPSPFQEKDLDQDAEEFIVSWAREYPRDEPVTLLIHVSQPSEGTDQALVKQAVQNYFAYRANMSRLEFKRLMRQGRTSMIIGVLFLTACLSISGLLGRVTTGFLKSVGHEGLFIMGWVAMWRPLEIFLYEWWPVRRLGLTYEKLSHMDVQVLTRK